MKNWPLIIQTAVHIVVNPDAHDQGNWVTRCGTRRCFAGWSVHLAGCAVVHAAELLRLFGAGFNPTLPLVAYNFVHVPQQYRPRLPRNLEYGTVACWASGVAHVRDAAIAVLGISEQEGEDLFAPDNSVADLLEIIRRWARRDGVALPEELRVEIIRRWARRDGVALPEELRADPLPPWLDDSLALAAAYSW